MSSSKKVVIVTGGSRGIGLAIVKKLRREGYAVIPTSTQPRKGHFVLDLLKPSGVKSFMDLLRAADVNEIYGLVNNAGICEKCQIGLREDAFVESWSRIIQVNLTGAAELTHRLIANNILQLKNGRIVNIASQLGKVGRAGFSAYCASKFGLIGLTEAWSREIAVGGTTVNAVCPGWIETEMVAKELTHAGDDHARRQIASRLDQRRFNTPQEVANIVAFLLSTESSGITGRCIEMAGPSA